MKKKPVIYIEDTCTKFTPAINPKLKGTLFDGAYAHYLQKVSGGMTHERAIEMTLGRLDNAFVPVKIQANGQTLLVPNNSEAFPIQQV